MGNKKRGNDDLIYFFEVSVLHGNGRLTKREANIYYQLLQLFRP